MTNQKKMYRTDLALDEVEHIENQASESLYEERQYNEITAYRLVVDNHLHDLIGKKKGIYYTIDLGKNNYHDYKESESIEKGVASVLKELLEEHNLIHKKCLVVGLGNDNVTPDALGPYVLDRIIVTRHLFTDQTVSNKYSEVSGITPGVMGNTGIETYDIIKSVVNSINVDYLIVVDALASSSIMRINRTIQITDTGISPGSGVGNKRKELSYETIGVPVIAIGVPTVVDFVTITTEVIDLVLKYLSGSMGNNLKANFLSKEPIKNDLHLFESPSEEVKNYFLGEIGKLNDEERQALINQAITDNGYNLMVTPKDVDMEIEDLSKIIAMSINMTLHETTNE